MPIPISPLEDLATKVQKDATTVTPAMVEAAFKKEKEAIEKKYNELREQGDKAERAAYLERLDAFKARLLRALRSRESLHASGRGKVISEAVTLRKGFYEKMKERKTRHDAMKKARDKARAKAHMMTNPDAEGALIDDYEGWDVFGDKLTDANYNNDTRWLLTGWTTAHEMYDPAMANAVMSTAVDVYESPSVGNALDKEPMMKGLGMTKYVKRLGPYGLAPEAAGFVGGYLSLADKQMPEESASYGAYVTKVLNELKASGALSPRPRDGVSAMEQSFYRGVAQLNALVVLRSPKEWVAMQEKMRQQFDELVRLSVSISSGIGFKYEDADLKKFLARPKEGITFADEDNLLKARAQIRKEAFPHLQKVHQNAEESRTKILAKFEEVVKKNANGKEFTDEQIKQVRNRLEAAESRLKMIAPLATDSLEQIAKYSGPMRNVMNELGVLKPKIEDMDKAVLAAIERRKREEEERKRREKEEKKAEKERKKKRSGKSGSEDLKGSKEPLRSRFEAGAKLLVRKGAEAKYYDKDGKLVGTLDDNAKLTLAEDRAIKKIGGKIHAKVIYKGQEVWVKETDLEQVVDKNKYKPSKKVLIKEALDNYVSHEEQHEKAAKMVRGLSASTAVSALANERLAGTSTVEVTSDVVDLLPNVEINLMYAKALNLIAEYTKNVDMYPNGVDVRLPFNGIEVNCHVQYRSRRRGQVAFTPTLVPRESFYYRSMDAFMRSLNSGYVHRKMTRKVLGEPAYYQNYDGLVDQLDFTDPMKVDANNKYTHHLEFDWKGWIDDPDIYVRALKHGRLEYKIQWRYVNHDGKKWRHGYAENFRDFMYKLRHYRDWALGYKKIDKSVRHIAETREKRYEILSNPYFFRNHEDQTGRIIKFRADDDYSVSMFLDWGGGNDLNSSSNVQVDMGVSADGKIFYTIKKIGAERALGSGTSNTVSGVRRAIARLRG